ncbi:GlsB/YeaQ/YmgE family stress response membrane protein [Sphingobium nicotianae]|uniref:GlsB/YeaQ/YmgE family stress response membrane protein n=1 Tax=Sphingobium nicotianae TaxID=2782607 RepID=A0A9X1DDH3_9SPHN|nr:GlsB/YeaQ/YmgE family stress response membrane protein [Sphingobium nicotianae]MBT2187899.1 GlsB/YeaQ/YmgE family stress response membrane protein [Sphingobium nicotianae]
MGRVISTIIVGLIVGILARWFYPGVVPMNWIASIVLGIVGSLIGGAIPRVFSKSRAMTPFQPAGLIGSVLGAMLVIFIVRHLN